MIQLLYILAVFHEIQNHYFKSLNNWSASKSTIQSTIHIYQVLQNPYMVTYFTQLCKNSREVLITQPIFKFF